MGIVVEQDNEGSLIVLQGAIGIADAAELKALLLQALGRAQSPASVSNLDPGAELTLDPGIDPGLKPALEPGLEGGLDSRPDPGHEDSLDGDLKNRIEAGHEVQAMRPSDPDPGPDQHHAVALDSGGRSLPAANRVCVSLQAATYLDVTALQLIWAAATQAQLCGVGFQILDGVSEPVAAALGEAGFQSFLCSVQTI